MMVFGFPPQKMQYLINNGTMGNNTLPGSEITEIITSYQIIDINIQMGKPLLEGNEHGLSIGIILLAPAQTSSGTLPDLVIKYTESLIVDRNQWEKRRIEEMGINIKPSPAIIQPTKRAMADPRE